MKIQDGIKSVIEALEDGETGEAAILEASDDWHLNPMLLARKFAEQHGCTPAEFLSLRTSRGAAPVVAGSSKTQRARAVELARDAADNWNFSPEGEALVGRLFTFMKHDFALIAFDSRARSWNVKAIRVSDGTPRKLRDPSGTIAKQVL